MCVAILNRKISRKSLIFTAEVWAVDIALNIISENNHKSLIIFLHLFSVLSLRNLKNCKMPYSLNSWVGSMYNSEEILMYWIPSHIGIKGNLRTDSAAKSTLDFVKFKILYFNLKPKINKIFLKCQQHGNNNIHNKFSLIKPALGEWRWSFWKSRKEQVAISWLNIGYTRLIPLYSNKRKDLNV